MKLSIETEDIKASVEISRDSDIHDVVEAISGILVLLTFHPDTITEGFEAYIEEHNENN